MPISTKYYTKRQYTQHLKINKVRNIVLAGISLFCLGLLLGNKIYTEYVLDSYQTIPEVHAQEVNHQTPIEYAMQEAGKAGINPHKVFALLALCENKQLSTEADYINWKNQAGIDRGFWMINSIHHKEVSNSCAYNLECSTKAAIRILKQRGFKEWSCGKDLGSLN